MKLKKLFALLLCACMLLSVLPMGTLAGLLTVGDAPAQEEEEQTSGGFLTVDGDEPEEEHRGFLTVDGDEPEDEHRGFLTVDGDEDGDEDDEPAPVIPAPSQVYICEWCGWADGYHADDCPSHVDEEPDEPAEPADGESEPKPDKSEVRAYAAAANTFADIFDALLEAEDLDEYEAILNELDEEQQALFFDLLDEDELDALEAVEGELAYAAVETFSLRDTTRSSVSLDVAVQSMSAALRDAMQELADRLGAWVASMLGKSSITLRAFTLPEDRCTAVEAFASRSEAHEYQWQILAGEDADGEELWANILGAEGKQLLVTYAMVANLLDGDDQAQLRCVIDGEATDAAITATVDYNYHELWDAEDGVIDDEEPVEDEVIEDEIIEDEAEISTLALMGAAMPLDADVAVQAEGDTAGTCTITVTYVFEDDSSAASPYTVSLGANDSYSPTVTFPTVQGYLPYIGETQQKSCTITNTGEDQNIKVVYKPDDVNYTVKHYQQNVDNDQYTEVEGDRETLTGKTGTPIGKIETKTYEGFYSLLYDQNTTIAADGSTVIEVYYDRYYYLMNFDMDGGYGTDPVYARYGATIGEVKEPTKAGYEFKGWSETKGGTTAVTLPTTMPAESKTYYAIWEVGDTAKVTVVFWGENADDEKYSYLSDYTKEINLKPGTEFTYSETGMLTCGKGTHTHTDDCYEFTCTTEAHEHNSDCYTCGNAEHKHGVGCYPGASSEIPDGASAPWNAPSNPKNGQILTETHILVTRKYIYINGNWYTYTGNVSSGSVVSPNCGMTEHTHTTACIGCGKTEHEHTRANCYKLTCKEEEHTHTSACYEQGAGLDSTLWKFVKSDTITVAADGKSIVNVYYDRVEYSVQFYENQNCSSNREYTSLKITAKWGENILSKWPTYNGSSSWYVKDKSNTWQNSIQVMPVGGAKFWGPKSGNSKYTATYYVEILDGESYDVKGNDGRYYKVHHTDTSNSSGNVTDEERYGIDGFTINNSISTSNGGSYGGSKFYYTRNSYKLTFNDQYDDVKNETVKFEASLSTYKDYVPEVPSAYETGSVEFGGWYQNPECTGEEYKLDEHTMPASDIILYAKWVPVNRTVKFYLTEKSESIYKPASAETEASFTVPHGDNIAEEYVKKHLEKSAMNDAKPNGDYTFVMWYYYENGEKMPFDPTTQIRKDLTLYGEWRSDKVVNYTVQYMLAEKKDDGTIVIQTDAEGKPIKVADDLTSSGLVNTSKTVEAKGGTALYAAYQEGYFPTVRSTSIRLDADTAKNVYTFEYVYRPVEPYTVKYINTETNTNVFDGVTVPDKVVSDNRKAVVTENFVNIPGYMPDASQKRLIVTAGGEDNVIIFYYTKDTTHACYTVTHYTQNLDGTWAEDRSSSHLGDIGQTYSADPVTIDGFTYQKGYNQGGNQEVKSGKLTSNGLELKLYYTRNSYPYQVRYLESETNADGDHDQLHDPKNGTGKYGQVISVSAIDIDGYDKVDLTSATLNIRIDEDEGAPNLNIITFYYKEQEVTISYVAVGPTGATNFGSVTPTTETVKIKSGTAQGSTPTAGDGFKFVGWFTDEGCTQPVDTSWVTDNKIVPQKTDDKNVAATYYAKFEYDVADLTITKTGANETIDPNQTFIFTITSKKGYSAKVVIKGNGSVTIKNLEIDTYTIHEENGWSWRYSCTDQTKTLQPGQTNAVTMSNSRNNDKWLDGNAVANNVYGQTANTSPAKAALLPEQDDKKQKQL